MGALGLISKRWDLVVDIVFRDDGWGRMFVIALVLKHRASLEAPDSSMAYGPRKCNRDHANFRPNLGGRRWPRQSMRPRSG